jgi:hypothetical protein
MRPSSACNGIIRDDDATPADCKRFIVSFGDAATTLEEPSYGRVAVA